MSDAALAVVDERAWEELVHLRPAPKKQTGACSRCGKKLNQYSPAPLCFACDDEFGRPMAVHIQCANKLTPEERSRIYAESLAGATQYALAKRYHVSRSCIEDTICKLKGES